MSLSHAQGCNALVDLLLETNEVDPEVSVGNALARYWQDSLVPPREGTQTPTVEYHPMVWPLLKNLSLGINDLSNYLPDSNLCFLGRSLRRR